MILVIHLDDVNYHPILDDSSHPLLDDVNYHPILDDVNYQPILDDSTTVTYFIIYALDHNEKYKIPFYYIKGAPGIKEIFPCHIN